MAMLKSCFVLPFLMVACLVSHSTTTSAARDFALVSYDRGVLVPTKLNVGELLECWEALSDIKACSNEITAFLMNGMTDIESPCCVAIMTITHSCWPALLDTIGFSAEQANILRGYCDAAGHGNNAANVPSPTPSAQPIS